MQNPEIGGGRIIGEVCHFVDMCMYLAGSPIKSLSAHVMSAIPALMDTLIVNLGFKNGSIAAISYFSNGNKNVPKEYLEIFYANQVAVIQDFKLMTLYSEKTSKYKLSKQDKGHAEEVRLFIEAIKNGKPCPISFDELYLSSLSPFKILESIQTGNTVHF